MCTLVLLEDKPGAGSPSRRGREEEGLQDWSHGNMEVGSQGGGGRWS